MWVAAGRDAERGVVDECLARARERLGVLVVEGDAGIGKTTVLAGAVDAAAALGFRVVSCRPVEAETGLAFASVGDLLAEVGDEQLEPLPAPQRHALEVALLRASPRGAPPDGRLVGTALLTLLRSLSAASPLAVVVDDVQWLDAASASALSFALRRLDASPVAVILAARTGQGDGAARAPADALGLDRALAERPVHLRLGPLSLSALYHVVREHTGVVFPRPTLQRIEQASGGNPLFAVELARALDALGACPGPGQPLPVPDRLMALIEERLGRLPADWDDVLVATALLAEPDVAVIETALGPAVRAVLAGAADAGVVDINGDLVRFRHPLLAAATVAAAPPAVRRRLHRRLAEVSDHPEQRARHLALAASGPDEAVASSLEEAARHATGRGAPEAASELLQLACDLTPPEWQDRSARRRLQLAEAAFRAGDTGYVRRCVAEVLQAVPSGPIRAMALELEARVLHVAGTSREAVARCEEALANIGERTELRAQVEATRALVEYQDIEAARRHAQAAIDLLAAAPEPDPLVHTQAILALAEAEVDLGRPIPMALVEQGLALEAAAPAPRVSDRLSAALGAWLKAIGRLDDARPWLEATLRAAIEEGDDSSLPYAWSHLPQLELWTGRWAEAEAAARAHLDASERTGQPGERLQALYNLALVHAHRGRVDEAMTAAATGLAESTDDWFQMTFSTVLGFVALSTGDPAGAAGHLDRAERVAAAIGVANRRRAGVDHVEALVATGETARAAELAASLEAAARATGDTTLLAGALRGQALVAAAEQRLDDAVALVDAAVDQHDRHARHEPFERARTLLVAGQLRRRRGERRAARDLLTRAEATFAVLPAPLWAARAAAELARIPTRRRSTTALTDGEDRVARLVAEGHTNAEVAQALFVSPKTVEATLTRVYGKLGIRSRTQLAAARARAGAPTAAGQEPADV
jgi:DNA-binding CsgD family transcriptional regulator